MRNRYHKNDDSLTDYDSYRWRIDLVIARVLRRDRCCRWNNRVGSTWFRAVQIRGNAWFFKRGWRVISGYNPVVSRRTRCRRRFRSSRKRPLSDHIGTRSRCKYDKASPYTVHGARRQHRVRTRRSLPKIGRNHLRPMTVVHTVQTTFRTKKKKYNFFMYHIEQHFFFLLSWLRFLLSWYTFFTLSIHGNTRSSTACNVRTRRANNRSRTLKKNIDLQFVYSAFPPDLV